MPRVEDEPFIASNGFEVRGMSGPNDDGDILHANFKSKEKGYVSLRRGYLLITHDATRTTVYVPLPANIVDVLSKNTPGQREVLEAQGQFDGNGFFPDEIKAIVSKMVGDEEF